MSKLEEKILVRLLIRLIRKIINMRNWKTTLGGLLSALGLGMSAMQDPTMHTVGIALAAIGTLLTGAGAKDHNVSGR